MARKTLIAYVSAGGATEEYARVIAEALRARGRAVDIRDLRREHVADVSSYGEIVVGAGVRMGMVYRKARRFLRRPDVPERRLAIFLSSGVAIGDPAKARERFLTPLVRKYGLSPVAYVAFPGKMIIGPGKLEDRTEPDVARRWAEDLATRLDGPEDAGAPA
jgi:menaquinone-dependent protoporphyrinogen IX oxidase